MAAGVIVLVGGMIYYRYRMVSPNFTAPLPLSLPSSNTAEKRLTSLEDAVALLISRVNNKAASSSASEVASGSVESRIQSLENTVANLQVQINQLKGGGTTSTTASGAKSPIYIPLGWNGSGSTQSWSSVSSQTISIDPADYSGYTSMQFEVNLGVYQGNGTAYARLFNKDDGLAIIPSEVSSTSESYTWVSSSTFQLPATTKKTYVLQVKTTTGYASQVQNARIRVNF